MSMSQAFPVYPGLHVQLNEPGIFLQTLVEELQGDGVNPHSSMSVWQFTPV